MQPNISKSWQKEMNNKYHETVLVTEVVDGLHIEKGGKYIDATLGSGGHALEILKRGGKVLGIEIDPKMLEIALNRLTQAGEKNFRLVEGNFTEIDEIAKGNGWDKVDGIIFDLGVTNLHLKDKKRGFSFGEAHAPLDMRMNPAVQGVTAADLLNVLREDQLRDLFEATLEPGAAKWIARRVIHAREQKPINSTGDLLEIARGLKTGKEGLNVATLPLLALRIAVNSELANLEMVLPKAFSLIKDHGRLVVISFHSKEDALVKSFFRKMAGAGARLITPKPITAGEAEIEENRRSRSAKMRILEK